MINFRDFGGLQTVSGARVRRDVFYRSGHMHGVAADKAERLLGYDFALIADLRYADERNKQPSPWPPGWAGRVHAHDGERSTVSAHESLFDRALADPADTDAFYINYYARLPFDANYRPLYARVLNRLVDLKGRALIHCSAGKDRTGVLVALIQHALGIGRDAIVANYMLTREATELLSLGSAALPRLEAALGADEAQTRLRKLVGVEEAYIAAALDAIEERCGSVDGWLDEAGLTAPRREQMRARFLEG